MKRTFKYAWGLFVVAILCISFYEVVFAASGQVGLNTKIGLELTSKSKAYANSQVDTVIWTREGAAAAYAFAIHFKDSASVTSIQLRRVIDGVATGFATTDSLLTGALITPRADSTIVRTITLAPLADQYWVIVTYTSSGNGVTSPTAVYEVLKQFSK